MNIREQIAKEIFYKLHPTTNNWPDFWGVTGTIDDESCRREEQNCYRSADHILKDILKLTDKEIEALEEGGRLKVVPTSKVVCLCGSTKFKQEFIDVNFKFTMQGYIVLSVGWFSHSDSKIYYPTPDEKLSLDELHKRKIDLADEVFVINKNGYIGESTSSEINYALKIGKPVSYMESCVPKDEVKR